jgi:hypothetical protein
MANVLTDWMAVVSKTCSARAALLTLLSLVPGMLWAQGAAGASDPAVAPSVSPAEVERIQRALNQPPGLKLTDQQLRFYLEIVAKQPTFADYVRGYDFINGPTKGGNPMSHDEFVKMVTPKHMYGSAGITPAEQLQFALTNYIGQSLIRKALEELKEAKDEREIQAIRDRIDRELDALTGAARSRSQ